MSFDGSSRKRQRTRDHEDPLARLWLRRLCDAGSAIPRPALEQLRRAEVLGLRARFDARYADVCKEVGKEEGAWQAPRESFNKWLMERLNGKGMDPLWGGNDLEFQVSGTAEEADEALRRRLCRDLLLGLDAETAATAESRVRRICSQLTSEAAAAAKSLHGKLKAECSSAVSTTFDARRGCYLFTLPGSPDSPAIVNACSDSEVSGESAEAEPGGSSEAFAISPSALARLAFARLVCSCSSSLPFFSTNQCFHQDGLQLSCMVS